MLGLSVSQVCLFAVSDQVIVTVTVRYVYMCVCIHVCGYVYFVCVCSCVHMYGSMYTCMYV
jgi:hypothetical protein